ncbi:copper-binding protein [Variovorax ginsengisoli]|uniref:Copper-binding protein n=1 Tax=Variovorax ginsengisoli TaxID=363844 RepID=A0ABT8S5C1_9BURK|nr:copper-binding protein [Variovorax ginsengisoli]MDN8614946.1 copper-binding protein [Variovorax ginsengisoli]MDO1534116.1 copper-binding protein [Variovorax ginsengisoli]
MTRSNLLAALITLSIAAVAHAQATSTTPQGAAATAAAPMTDGEVRRVDKEAGKVTLRHGPIANLDMPGMTMVFKAPDPKILENLKEGDKVRFSADRINGAMAVTRIETAN